MGNIHMATTDYSTLALSPLLVGLREEELQALIGPAEQVHFKAGEVVVEEGTPGDTMFMIYEGSVCVEKRASSGQVVELALIEESGEFFGEMVFVDVLPRSASIRARSDVVLLALGLDILRQFFAKYKDAHLNITLNIARMLSKRLRLADEKIAQLVVD
ncbi:MAG: cyclic nucleotide-binding domain-containing protein [Candidatus Latescibacteria bacterium]|nr:cyclic nucleotide-binding domain-containing protein [Candidatus Latescibacterota bacterium]